MIIQNPQDYTFIKFEKSHLVNKKYNAILKNKKTGREKKVPFGQIKPDGIPYEQFRDTTGLRLYSKYDHHDLNRRHLYLSRHEKDGDNKFSSGWFSKHYLW